MCCDYMKWLIEFVFGAGLFINALLFLPQAFEIYKTKNSEGQSLLTFAGFNIIQLVTVLHAHIHDDYLLFWGYLLALVSCGAVTVLIIIYRKK